MRRAVSLLARVPPPWRTPRAPAHVCLVLQRGLATGPGPGAERIGEAPLPAAVPPSPAGAGVAGDDLPDGNDGDVLSTISAVAGAGAGSGVISAAADAVLSVQAAAPALGAAGAVVACAVAVRGASTPLLYFHQLHSARAAVAGRELAAVQAWVRKAPGTLMQKYVTFRRLRAVAFRSAGTRPAAQFPWFLAVHVPLVCALSLGVRAVAAQRPASWAAAGPAWAPDLCAADPTGALPVFSAALWLWNLGSARAGPPRGAERPAAETKFPLGAAAERAAPRGESPSRATQVAKILDQRRGQWLTTALQGVVLLSFPYILDVPSAVHILWIANGVLTGAQRTAIRSDTFRRAVGLPTAEDIRQAEGPPVLRATAEAMRSAREQLEYVQNKVLTKFPNRTVDERLRRDVNRALERELFARRISIRLEAVVRRDGDSGRRYLAVVKEGSGKQ